MANSINPAEVPAKTLADGGVIPVVGLGTFGSDHCDNDSVAAAVKESILNGYRHIDCASVYGNEKEIGKVLAELFRDGVVKREDLWITSKVWNDMHHDPEKACRQTLEDLGLEYLDLYLVHWPFPNFHAKGVSVDSRDPNAVPYIHENFMKTWRVMEHLQKEGLVRHIGTSNMTVPKMKLLLQDCEIRPVVNEMELHPHFQQNEFVSFLLSNGIQPIGFCPLGSPNRPERDKTPEDTDPMSDTAIREIAEAHGIHPAAVCIKWAVQRGEVVIPFSTKSKNIVSNLRCVTEDPLTDEEMERIAGIDRKCRLIKGQVFCWTGAEWPDLWDEDGTIKTW